MSLYDILQELKSNPSTNFKCEILGSHKDNQLFIDFLKLVYDKINYTWGIKTYTQMDTTDLVEIGSEEVLISTLRNISSSSKSPKQFIQSLKITDPQLLEIMKYILDRSIGVGVSIKLITKYVPKVQINTPYQKCESYEHIDRIVYPAMIQTKMDGLFINMKIEDGQLVATTRNGKKIDLDGAFGFLTEDKSVLHRVKNTVLHGELLVIGEDKKPLPRKEGNGRINSLFKRKEVLPKLKAEIEEAKSKDNQKLAVKKIHALVAKELDWTTTENNLQFVVWDIIPVNDWEIGSCEFTTDVRFDTLQHILENELSDFTDKIKLVKNDVVANLEEAQDFYQARLEEGEEGAVIKNLQAPWINGTNRKGVIKMKDFKECDLVITGYTEGTGKYAGKLGALCCESYDGKLQVNVGSGLSDEERNDILDEDGDFIYQDRVAAIKYVDIIESRVAADTVSLFCPSLIEIRSADDKFCADTLEQIKGSGK